MDAARTWLDGLMDEWIDQAIHQSNNPSIHVLNPWLNQNEISLVARAAATASRWPIGSAAQNVAAAGPMPAQSRLQRTGRHSKLSPAPAQEFGRPVPAA